ncbi:MAG: hypothetical protein K2G12_07565 [Prevotella sp.]|nr:hypothetical protein [Prevotella sp.]
MYNNIKTKCLFIALLLQSLICGAQTCYTEKYAKVLEHFSNDSLKKKAATFLIDNMDGHSSPEGNSMKLYTDKIMSMWPKTAPKYLDAAWDECKGTERVSYVSDSMLINNAMLIDYIDDAFIDWRESPWRDDITFTQFCDYILPYRVRSERLSKAWRKKLREKYLHIIDGVKDMKTAFEIVSDSVKKELRYWIPTHPYTLDVLTYDHIQRASCDQQCILLTSILRSLGIPAVIDGISKWADYSTKGHAWVALVMSDGSTYTIFDNEHEAKQFNKINASFFESSVPVTEDDICPYNIKQSKSVSKTFRYHFRDTRLFSKADPKFLYDRFAADVSSEYGLSANITVPVNTSKPVYLCTFLTGRDWIPVAKALPAGESVTFHNVGSGIVCLPVVKDDRQYIPICSPILTGRDGITKIFDIDETDTCTITLTRKYPLCAYVPGEWKKIVGGCFEASDNPDFVHPDTIAVIYSMPYGVTSLPVTGNREYRYVRFKSPDTMVALATELSFYSGKDERIKPSCWFSTDVDTSTVRFLSDNDRETRIRAMKPGYSVGIDIGQPRRITRIDFAPASDGNDVEAGHLYELYMFARKWRLLGSKRAKGGSVTFHGIPRGALLLLRDRTRGHEERIFEYKDNKQQWY